MREGGARIGRKIHLAFMLSLSDWWVLLQAWLLLLAVDVALRLLPYRRVQQWVAAQPEGSALRAGEAIAIRRLERLVDIAARNHLYPMRCLRRALVLQRLSSRRGIPTELRIGVRKEGDQLLAHAWLEHAGQPVGEPQRIGLDYVPLLAWHNERRAR